MIRVERILLNCCPADPSAQKRANRIEQYLKVTITWKRVGLNVTYLSARGFYGSNRIRSSKNKSIAHYIPVNVENIECKARCKDRIAMCFKDIFARVFTKVLKMKAYIPLCVCVMVLLQACGGVEERTDVHVKKASGGRYYGGVFALNEVDNFRSLFPLELTQASAHRIANQIFEGLVKLDQNDLSLHSSLAESWEVNEEATIYTFKLREGVKFHNDKCFPDGIGREFNAYDVEYCFRRLCTDLPENQMFWLFQDRIVGGNEHFEQVPASESEQNSIAGIQALDDHTIRIELVYPFSGFLNTLSHQACWIYPAEMVSKYAKTLGLNCVGTGPFRQNVIKEKEVVILERNEDYWGHDEYGNKLPFLSAIKVTFEREKSLELLEFKKGNLSAIYELPPAEMDIFKNEETGPKGSERPFIKQSVPSLSVQYYGFQHQGKIFSDINVRRAFNHAIDREKIVEHTLGGQGVPASSGIVPPSFEGYITGNIPFYELDPEKARAFLAKAGYPDGKGFPRLVLQVSSGGYGNIAVAEAVQSMLGENLNIEVEISVLPTSQHYDRVEDGDAEMWRAAWIADYSDPENFLNLLFGKHVPKDKHAKAYMNAMRYQNSNFDSAFSSALEVLNEEERMELYRRADSIAMSDAAILPIYYELGIRLLHPKVRNFPINPMEYRDLSEVYFSPVDSVF